jgi:hypothetical protein
MIRGRSSTNDKGKMTEEIPTGIVEYLDYCYKKHFVALIERHNMIITNKLVEGIGAFYEATAGDLKIRLVNDRGTINFDISPAYNDDYWYVELVYDLLNINKKQIKGIKRLSLEQQADLIDNHWHELQSMFSKSSIENTRKTLKDMGKKRADFMLNK